MRPFLSIDLNSFNYLNFLNYKDSYFSLQVVQYTLQDLGFILQVVQFTLQALECKLQSLEYILQTLGYKKTKQKKGGYSVAAFNISPKVG